MLPGITVHAESSVPSNAWTCGQSFPSGSFVDPFAHRATLPNGTKFSLPLDCSGSTVAQFGYSCSTSTCAVAQENAFLATGTPSFSNVGGSLHYCTSTTSCSLTGTVTAGHVVAVAMQGPSGGSVGVKDNYYSSYSGQSTGGGTSEAVGVFYVKALGSGSYSDTITATDTVSGTIALEAWDVSGVPSGWTASSAVTGSCTSSCSSTLSTSSLEFQQSAFLIASAFASPGSSSSTPGPGFSLIFGTYNALRAGEVGTSTSSSGVSNPTNFQLNDAVTSFPRLPP